MNSEQHTTAKVWLITGASRGMGHAIMEAALAAGHCVAAVSRSGEITTHIEDGAAQLLPYALDVTNTEQAVFDRDGRSGREALRTHRRIGKQRRSRTIHLLRGVGRAADS